MPPNSQLTAHCLCPQSLLRTELNWHSSLIAGFLLAAKILNDERVFASDARIIASHNSTSQDLIVLEQRAFAVLLPSMGGIHGRALIFRVALLNLALDSNPAPQQVFKGHVHILVAQSDAVLLSEQMALAESTAPNATVHAVGSYAEVLDYADAQAEADSYAEALDYADAQAEADSPVHLVLLGVHAVCGSANDNGEAEALIDMLHPQSGGLAIDMRVKPLIAMVSSVPQLPGTALYIRGVDAVLDDHNLTAHDVKVLLDFT